MYQRGGLRIGLQFFTLVCVVASIVGCNGSTSDEPNDEPNDELSDELPSKDSANTQLSGMVLQPDPLRVPVTDFTTPAQAHSSTIRTDTNLQDAEPRSEQPGYRAYRQEQVSGMWLTRVTDNAQFGIVNGSATHAYSRRQVWNANETLIDAGNRLISADSYLIVSDRLPVSDARRWAHTHPDLMYAFVTDPAQTVFGYYDVRLEIFTPLRTIDEYDHCTIGSGEGNLSDDDRYVVFSCSLNQTGETWLLSYDITNDMILGRTQARDDYNWASFSPSGEFILVENNSPGRIDPEELVRYRSDFSEKVVLTNQRYHGDLGTTESGEDVFVMIGADHFLYIRIHDGLRVVVPISEDVAGPVDGHISCRSVLRPGWCYFSSVAGSRLGAFRVYWDGSGSATLDPDEQLAYRGVSEVEVLGFHRSSQAVYESTARASVSPSGSKIAFASDWHGQGEIALYVLQQSQPSY